MILVTGGAGFIGSNFICEWLARHDEPILNLDALTYAGNLDNLKEVEGDNRHTFVHGNILDEQLLIKLFNRFHPRAVIHFAAESHVDRSIVNPSVFVDTNVKGTTTLLNVALHHWEQLNPENKATFRFINISTDEVYGSLSSTDAPKTENDAFNPSSPYSASKAAGDQLGKAYYITYGLPVITIRPSNNYGPHQHPEKFIPLVINNLFLNQTIPVYGDGKQIREWTFVKDTCLGIMSLLEKGIAGESYNFSSKNAMRNIDMIREIHRLISLKCSVPINIHFTEDRLGHDIRYSLSTRKFEAQFPKNEQTSLKEGLLKSISWYKEKLRFELTQLQ